MPPVIDNNALVPPGGPYNIPTISSDGGNQYGNQLNTQIGSYTVQPGETLSGIGQMFGVPWQQIYSLNQGTIGSNPNMIQPGMTFQIPGGGPQNSGSLGGTMTGTQLGPNMFGGTQPPPSGVQPPQSGTQLPSGNAEQTLEGVPQFAYTPEQQQYLNSFTNYQNQIMGLSSMVDSNYNAELAEINAEMNNLKLAQQQENEAYVSGLRQAGIVSGLSQFTPEIMKGSVKMAVDQGIKKLTDLAVKQRGLIREAQDANLTRKMSILKELKSIDSEKYQTAREMKADFYTNLKNERELERETVAENLPSLYDELRTLPPEARDGRLMQYAQQLGVPLSRLKSYYREYDRAENKAIADYRTKMAEVAFDVPFTYDDIYNSTPQQFMQKLMSSKVVKNQLLSSSMDIALKQAQINKYNAEASAASATGQLSPKQVPQFNAMVNKYNTSPLVAANDRATILRDITKRTMRDPSNASNQVAFIYSFIQALDTYNSAVREGEIGFVAGTAGLAQKLENLPNKIMRGTILSTTKMNELMSVANSLTTSIANGAKSKTQTFRSQANVTGVGAAFDEFLMGSGNGLYQPPLNSFLR